MGNNLNIEDWKEVRLGDVCILITKGTTPSTVKGEFLDRGINYFRSECLINSKYLDVSQIKYISESVHEKLKRSQILEKDILFSMAGAFLGKTAVVKNENTPANTNQAVAIIRLNHFLVDVDYIYYFLNLKSMINFINTSSAQSAQPNINLKQIGDLTITLPPLPTQKKIAQILSSIDDKIELNNAINKNLEEISQTLFKQWFVDFEFPNENGESYKSSGGEMVESELGMIPKGWTCSSFGEITTERTERIKDNEATVLSAVKTSELVLSEEYFTKQVFSKSIEKYKRIEQYDFGYNPSRINIGSIGLHKDNFLGAMSPVYVVFRTQKNYHWYFEFILKLERIKNEIIQRCSGSVRQALNYDSFSLIKVAYPPESLVLEFNKKYEDYINMINHIKAETQTLTKLRDELLPKLMSGEIQV